MKKETMLKISIIFVFLFLMILPFILKSFRVTNLSISDISEKTKIAKNSFIIKSIDYQTEKNKLYATYKLKEKSGKTQELSAILTLRYLDGEKIAEEKQNIILEAEKEGVYKTTLISPYNIKGFLKLTLTVSNDRGSRWLVKDVDNSKSYITSFAMSQGTKKAGLIIATITLGLALICLIILYLRKHYARIQNTFPGMEEKSFIKLDIKTKKK